MAESVQIQQLSSETSLAYYSTSYAYNTFTMVSGFDTLTKVGLWLREQGTLPSNFTVEIRTTSGGKPTSTVLGSVNLTSSNIGSSLAEIAVNFSPDLTLTAGVKYAIVCKQTSVTSLSNAVYWGYDDDASLSGGNSGNAGYGTSSGSSWTALSGNFALRVYLDNSSTAPTGVATDLVDGITINAADVDITVATDGGSTITERGAAYSTTNTTPTITDSKTTTTGTTGSGTVNLTGLSAGTTYYVRAYATNAVGTTYGDALSFITSTTTPTVLTGSVSSVTSSTAVIAGTISSDGGAGISEKGVCWNTSTNPTTANSKATSTGGTTYSVTASSLTAGTLYYARAYAINANGTSYGDNKTFTTLNTVKYWAQSFGAGATGTLTSVSLQAKLVFGASGSLKVRIYNSVAGSPNTLLYTANTVQITNSAYQTITIPINQAVTNTAVYWIVIEDIKTADYHIWLGSNSGGGYASGAIKYTLASAPSTWINTSHTTDDMYFVATITPSITATYDVEMKSKKFYK